MLAIKTIGEGLKELGLMKGNIEHAIEQAATALVHAPWAWPYDGA
jgi:hypothetical protein